MNYYETLGAPVKPPHKNWKTRLICSTFSWSGNLFDRDQDSFLIIIAILLFPAFIPQHIFYLFTKKRYWFLTQCSIAVPVTSFDIYFKRWWPLTIYLVLFTALQVAIAQLRKNILK